MDPATPAGFVAEAEEMLGKARALRDQARDDYKRWTDAVERFERYLRRVRQWERDGGCWPAPKKPHVSDA